MKAQFPLKKIAKQNYPFIVYQEKSTKLYIAVFPDLPGCHAEAKSLKELINEIYYAKETWIEGTYFLKEKIPEPSDFNNFSGKFTIRLPKTLYKEVKNEAKKEKISINRFLLYILSGKEKYHYRDYTPSKTCNDSTGKISLRIPSSLHQKLYECAIFNEVSLNQYILYVIAEHIERSCVVFYEDKIFIKKWEPKEKAPGHFKVGKAKTIILIK
ncbi:type II toxin-antitoxin system HicB family antitoxin [Candidatus Dependentiae bacterium]|nr:type II toxin-antitoxin system HicB family antitoxin [Candidatus Dependentiae bacterium]